MSKGRQAEAAARPGAEPSGGFPRRPMTAPPAAAPAAPAQDAHRHLPSRRRRAAPGPDRARRQRPRRVPRYLEHFKARNDVAFLQDAADLAGSHRQQRALEQVQRPRAVRVHPTAADRGGVAGTAPQWHPERAAQPPRRAGVVEVRVGEHVCGNASTAELPCQATLAPTHTGIDDDGAQQIDVQGPARTATGQAQARASSRSGWGPCTVALISTSGNVGSRVAATLQRQDLQPSTAQQQGIARVRSSQELEQLGDLQLVHATHQSSAVWSRACSVAWRLVALDCQEQPDKLLAQQVPDGGVLLQRRQRGMVVGRRGG